MQQLLLHPHGLVLLVLLLLLLLLHGRHLHRSLLQLHYMRVLLLLLLLLQLHESVVAWGGHGRPVWKLHSAAAPAAAAPAALHHARCPSSSTVSLEACSWVHIIVGAHRIERRHHWKRKRRGRRGARCCRRCCVRKRECMWTRMHGRECEWMHRGVKTRWMRLREKRRSASSDVGRVWMHRRIG